jgi:hypothetical protein
VSEYPVPYLRPYLLHESFLRYFEKLVLQEISKWLSEALQDKADVGRGASIREGGWQQLGHGCG